jgi:arginyl-tRNA synthetase
LIANFAYDLAKAFNDFYNQCPVLNAEPAIRAARLALVAAARTCLAKGFNPYGHRAPEVYVK